MILGAGLATRMGTQKLMLRLERGRLADEPLLSRALRAAAPYPRLLVAGATLASALPAEPNLTVIVNDAPERGMAHSLVLADAAIRDREAALVVLLGDMPLVDAELVASLVAARGDADVAYPIRGGVPGHPVVFGPRPRAEIARLPDGDTLRSLRSDPRFTRVELVLSEGDERAFADVDTPEDFARVRARLEPSPPEAKS